MVILCLRDKRILRKMITFYSCVQEYWYSGLIILCARVLVLGFNNTELIRNTRCSAPNSYIIKICWTVLHGTVPVEINSEIHGGL